MRLVNLDEKNNDRYKVVLSREDWKKILLEINRYVGVIMFIIVFFGSILLYAFYLLLHKLLYSVFYILFVSLKWVLFYSLMLLFIGLLFRSYYKSFTTVLRPFYFRGMVIDVVGKKILLKNKSFSFKDTDTLVFSLERKREKNELSPKNNYDEKEKTARDWVYYVKKKVFLEPNSEELGENGFLDSNLEGFIIPPVEIKYLEDFSLILGKEGLLGTWRQIAKLLGVCFEENIEFEEKVMLQPKGNNFFFKKNNDSGFIGEHSSLDEKGNDKEKMRDFLDLLREKVEEKETSRDTSWGSDDFEEYLLFEEELMGVRMFSAGFEFRFWSGASEFPSRESVINKKFVFKKLINVLGYAMFVFPATFLIASRSEIFMKIGVYLGGLFIFISLAISELGECIEKSHSKEFLLRIIYLLERSSAFLFGVILIILCLPVKSQGFNISPPFAVGFLLCVLIFFSVLSDLHSFSCPWNLIINRFMSRLVFSFEDKVLEGEYGFCVSRTHWRAPVSKIRFLGLLGIGRSLFGSGDFLLAIKIDEDYVVLPLPKLEEDKIREILFFLQEVFNTLLAAFYSVNNMGWRK